MSKTHQAPVDDQLSDAALTERVRAGAPTAYPATEELRRRHLPAVDCYARLCARDRAAADQLAAQAFALAWQEVHRGIDPRGPWRHRLLMLVHQAAAVWAAGTRRERLGDDYAAFIDDIRGAERRLPGLPGLPVHPRLHLAERSVLSGAFAVLPQHTQGLLWHAVVERENAPDVARWTGERPTEVADLTARARDALREAYLRTHLDRSEDPRCKGFGRLLDAAARRDDARRNEDVDRHLAHCPGCSGALETLIALEHDPRPLLAAALLGWAGPAYLAARSAPALPAAAPAPPAAPAMSRRRRRPGPLERLLSLRTRYPSPLVSLLLVTVAGLAATGLVYATGDDPAPTGNDGALPRPPAHSVTVTATATQTVTPSPTATREGPSRTPSASATVSASATRSPARPTRTPGADPPRRVPGGDWAQVVNDASGLCLDVRDEEFDKGDDVIVAGCDSGSASQQWRVDSRGLLVNGADSSFCLDSRGDTDRGLGIWACSSVEGGNAANLQFLVDSLGRVRPRIDPGTAMQPDGTAPGSTLSFAPTGTGDAQRWHAG
ncbi:ricin-type beta-trefoil lectin domain protein [Actinacidiphila glaucinigra]|uniref:ricin-type beta-trefoil lectin domain protein n=1 Tax=Actinacidiphila glaucinigra TaxID=235986 RepID=UPI00379D2730